ncbi:MAG TPA: hypothetical protein VL172_11940 [Kofleriaceae bacterium]|nr:hypothetical protein [Kofleriaceae bacterium]
MSDGNGSQRQLGGNAQVKGLTLLLAAEPRGRVEQVEVAPLQLGLGRTSVRADKVRIEKARTPGDGQQATLLVADRMLGDNLVLAGAGFTMTVASFEAREGVRLKRSGALIAQQLALEGVRFEFPDILAIGKRDGEPADRPAREKLRWEILDQLEGHLNVDLLVDLTGPIVGRREETHHFRVVIENGAIDYERLEGDVHWLERSFVDIHVADDKLELRRNIPLIPFSGKPLVHWPLDEEGLKLARANKVRLRNLLDWELPEEERERRAGGSRVKLNRVVAQNIDIALALAEPAWLDLGRLGRVRLAPAAEHGPPRAAITGELDHEAEQEARPTRLEAAVGPLEGALERLRLGAIELTSARLSPEKLRAELVWDEMRPTALVVVADRLLAEEVRFEPAR